MDAVFQDLDHWRQWLWAVVTAVSAMVLTSVFDRVVSPSSRGSSGERGDGSPKASSTRRPAFPVDGEVRDSFERLLAILSAAAVDGVAVQGAARAPARRSTPAQGAVDRTLADPRGSDAKKP